MIEFAVLLSWADSMELASLLTKQTVVTNTKKHFSYFKWKQCSTKHARTSCCPSLWWVVAPTSRTSCPTATPPTTSSWSSACKTPRSAATEACTEGRGTRVSSTVSRCKDAAEEKSSKKETESQRFKSTASSKVLRGQNTSNLEKHLEAAHPEVSERVQGMYFIIIPFKSARPMMHIYML